VLVSAQLPDLQPGASYHYALVAVPITSSGPDFPGGSAGADESLTALAEQLDLTRTVLRASSATVAVPLDCQSLNTCAGTLTLRLRGARGSTVTCATSTFSLGSMSQHTLSAHLSRTCTALLARSRGRPVGGAASARLSSGQLGFSVPITIAR